MESSERAPVRATLPDEERAVERSPEVEESPPGLERIRRFLATPWIRGIWLWLRLIGRGLRRAWRWTSKNAGPIVRGLERAATTGAEVARRTAEAGRIAKDAGKRVGRWASRRRGEGARGRFDEGLSGAAEGLDEWGGKLDREATDATEVLDSLGEVAGALAGGASALDREEPDSSPARRVVKPVAELPPAPVPEALPEPRRPRREPEERPAPADEGEAVGAGQDDRLADALARVRKLGRRRPRGPLRALILEIVAIQGSVTTAELAGWLGMGAKHLQKTHLRPMLKAGQLRLLHPDDPTHPEQAYLVADGSRLSASGELG